MRPSSFKVAVMGAGAVGCYFGGMLARQGHDVTLIARPAHVAAINEGGLRLQTTGFDERVMLTASTDAAAVQQADLILFCVKSLDTEAAGALMRPHLQPDALVLCLQNGVDSAQTLARGWRPCVTGTTTARPRRPSCSSGEPSRPTTSRRHPRRTASSRADRVSSVVPEQLTAMTRSTGPTQAGRP